jgi:glycosyltransferase involved in cell wall biosynthesis
VTDAPEPAVPAGLDVHRVASLRGTHSSEIVVLLATLSPQALVYLPTPLNLVTTGWLDAVKMCRRVGFASYPFYNFTELARAWWRLPWADVSPYLRHLLVPGVSWRAAGRRRCDEVIAQSQTTTGRLRQAFGSRVAVHAIPPGIDLAAWPWHSVAGDDAAVRLLYLGAATAIRGFDVTLDALSQVRDDRVRLRVLARGADADVVAAIHTAVARRGLGGRVEVEGGWIDRARLIDEIHAADAVLQPFVLVPSELPVTAMEVIACGTPVIGSEIDGLPSTIGAAGTVVAQGSASALAEAITRFAQDMQVRAAWKEGCRRQREAMLDWDTVTERWEAVLYG